jgi:hypothetical protein
MFDGIDGNKLDKDSDLRDVTPGGLAALKWPASFSLSDGRTPKTPERLRGHVRARPLGGDGCAGMVGFDVSRDTGHARGYANAGSGRRGRGFDPQPCAHRPGRTHMSEVPRLGMPVAAVCVAVHTGCQLHGSAHTHNKIAFDVSAVEPDSTGHANPSACHRPFHNANSGKRLARRPRTRSTTRSARSVD